MSYSFNRFAPKPADCDPANPEYAAGFGNKMMNLYGRELAIEKIEALANQPGLPEAPFFQMVLEHCREMDQYFHDQAQWDAAMAARL